MNAEPLSHHQENLTRAGVVAPSTEQWVATLDAERDAANLMRLKLLNELRKLIDIVAGEFDCGGEKECIKRYQRQVNEARAVLKEFE